MKKLFILAATACTILSSCSKHEVPIEEPISKIPINLSVNQTSRANDTTYENGDQVGIYVVNYTNATTPGTLTPTDNYVNNMLFELGDNGWSPESPTYWLDKTTKADFYAYYSYSASANTSAHTFSVNTDQSVEANYWASDFLWGKAENVAPTKFAVPITTNHVFSNVLIYLEAGDGFTPETLAAATKSVKITNVKGTASIDLATGIATATGNTTTITPWNTGEYYRALIVPQTIADGTPLITITINDVEYTLKLGATFVANQQHTITVTINRLSNGVNIGIGGWGDGTDYSGDAE